MHSGDFCTFAMFCDWAQSCGMWACVNSTCQSINPNDPKSPKVKGIPFRTCQQVCTPVSDLYVCVAGTCVPTSSPGKGMPKEQCSEICLP